MAEDAKALEDGPALEPTNRLRGFAAVEDVVAAAEAGAMSENRSNDLKINDLADFRALVHPAPGPAGSCSWQPRRHLEYACVVAAQRLVLIARRLRPPSIAVRSPSVTRDDTVNHGGSGTDYRGEPVRLLITPRRVPTKSCSRQPSRRRRRFETRNWGRLGSPKWSKEVGCMKQAPVRSCLCCPIFAGNGR